MARRKKVRQAAEQIEDKQFGCEGCSAELTDGCSHGNPKFRDIKQFKLECNIGTLLKRHNGGKERG